MRISDWSSDVCSSDLCGSSGRSGRTTSADGAGAGSVQDGWRGRAGTIGPQAGRQRNRRDPGFYPAGRDAGDRLGAIDRRTHGAFGPVGTAAGVAALAWRGRPGNRRGRRSPDAVGNRSEEHTSELQSLMRTSYAVFCLKQKKKPKSSTPNNHDPTSKPNY